MKLIFLDIDGVIAIHRVDPNSDASILPGLEDCDEVHFSKSRLENLAKIVTATDAKIILSSDWRMHENSRGIVSDKLATVGLSFIDTTPHEMMAMSFDTSRARQIKQKLKQYNPESFLIIDDMFLEPFFGKRNTILCNGSIGLGDEETDLAIRKLKNEKCY